MKKKSEKKSLKKNNSGASVRDTAKEQTVEVLYQKMGARWFSFYVIEDEVYMGTVEDNAITTLREHEVK